MSLPNRSQLLDEIARLDTRPWGVKRSVQDSYKGVKLLELRRIHARLLELSRPEAELPRVTEDALKRRAEARERLKQAAGRLREIQSGSKSRAISALPSASNASLPVARVEEASKPGATHWKLSFPFEAMQDRILEMLVSNSDLASVTSKRVRDAIAHVYRQSSVEVLVQTASVNYRLEMEQAMHLLLADYLRQQRVSVVARKLAEELVHDTHRRAAAEPLMLTEETRIFPLFRAPESLAKLEAFASDFRTEIFYVSTPGSLALAGYLKARLDEHRRSTVLWNRGQPAPRAAEKADARILFISDVVEKNASFETFRRRMQRTYGATVGFAALVVTPELYGRFHGHPNTIIATVGHKEGYRTPWDGAKGYERRDDQHIFGSEMIPDNMLRSAAVLED